jgi:MFS transporter, DHA2 family, multidrug resistance protein
MPDTSPVGLPTPQRYWAVLTVMLAVSMSVLDGAIANIALPTIARDLGTSPASSIWVVNAYQLAVTVSLLPLAALGELVEYRKVYVAGLALFSAASLGCAFPHTLPELAFVRTVQGFGAAGIMSVNAALVRFIFPRELLGRGMGLNAMVVSLAAAAGPTVGALILSVAHWQWLFLINVPIGVVALSLTRSLPVTKRAAHRFDRLGALLNAAAMGLFIIAIDGAGHHERWAEVVVEFAAAILFGTCLVWRELHRPWPLLPVDLLRIRLFALSTATSVCSFTGQMLAYVGLPFFLQDQLGFSQVATGLLMTPWPLATAVVAPISGRLADRYPAGALGAVGLAIFAAGLALLGFLPADPTVAEIAWRMAVCGVGFGIFQSPNNRAIIASAPPQRSGGASGMLGTARLVGQTVGAALVALLFGLVPQGGNKAALTLAACISAGAAAVSSLRLFEEGGRHGAGALVSRSRSKPAS